MKATGNCPAFVPRQRAVVTRLRTAGTGWICLLAFWGLAGAVALAQGTAPTNAPEKFSNADCLDCHLDPHTTRVVNGKTESLIFPTNAFAHSIHTKLACVSPWHQGSRSRQPVAAAGLHNLPRERGR